MICPFSSLPMISNLSGIVSSSMISEWYLAAYILSSNPSNKGFLLSIVISLIFPCINSFAGTTFPPYTSPIAWCPKQIPKIGISFPNVLITSFEIPALSGYPGPGEITSASRFCKFLISSIVLSSFRTTWICGYKDPIYWYTL